MSEPSLLTKAVPTEPSKPTWTSLPQEIKDNILSFANLPDLKSARLVCWNWANTASPFLFEELWLTPWTLCQLEDKRSLQTIHPHVRSLVLFSVILPEISFDSWQKVYKQWQDSLEESLDRSPSASLSDASESEGDPVTGMFNYNKRKQPWKVSEVESRFRSYSCHFHRQARFVEQMDAHDESLAAAGKNLSAFEEAINLFYNLSELTIGDDLWFHSGQTSGPYYPAGKRCGVWQDLEDLNDPYFNLYLPTFIHTFLSTVLKTLGHSRRNLPSLYAGTILYPTFESFTRLGQEDSQAVNHIFSNLEAIAVVLDNDDCSVIQDKNVVGQTWLVDVLSAAEKLRYVDVTMSYYGEFQKDPLKLFWSTKTMLWHLSVTNMAIAEDPFPSFLHKNARTLKEITLNSVLLQDNHGELGGNGWGNLLKPFAGMIQIETTQLHADPWGSILPESLNLLLEDPTCAQLLGEGLVNGVWEYEEEKFEDLCRALCLIHDTIPIDYAMRLVGGFASAD